MRRFREGQERSQLSFLPPSLDDYVKESDSVRYVDSLVEEFNFELIESKYSTIGRPGYSPRVLTKILLYGKLRGISSSRELSRACKENVRFMWLAQNESPDFRTICDFRRLHIKELGGLLKQTVRIGLEEGIITLEHVTIDGTKIRANASKNSFRKRKHLEELLRSLERSLEEDIEADEREDKERGDDDGEPKLPKTHRGKKELATRLREALKRSESDLISKTDPDSRIMKGNEGSHPSYNAQAAVDADSLMVVGATVSTSGNDRGELESVLNEIEGTAGMRPYCVTADAGYDGSVGLAALEERGIVGTVCLPDTNKGYFSLDNFIYDAEEDEYICPAGQTLPYAYESSEGKEVYKSEDCSGCPISSFCVPHVGINRNIKVTDSTGIRQRMKDWLRSSQAKFFMHIRAETSELIFAWEKTHKKMRQFIFRGLSLVQDVWRFDMAALNIERLIKIRMQGSA